MDMRLRGMVRHTSLAALRQAGSVGGARGSPAGNASVSCSASASASARLSAPTMVTAAERAT